MDDTQVVRRRTHGWPIAIALIVLAIVIWWAFFGLSVDPEPLFEPVR